jgi:hypothetical protein
MKWYSEKYVAFCEHLISKYPISRELTKSLCEMFNVQVPANITKTGWFTLLKILTCLKKLPELLRAIDGLREMLICFTVTAYQHTQEPLCFLYLIRNNHVLLDKADVETMFKVSPSFKQVLEICDSFVLKYHSKSDEHVALEGIGCFMNLLASLLQFPLMQKYIVEADHVGLALQMMQV